jgi:hypothetical protein
MVRRGVNNAETRRCTYLDKEIREPTVECSIYRDKRTIHIAEFEKIAWTITANPKGRVGFEPPKPSTTRTLDEILDAE